MKPHPTQNKLVIQYILFIQFNKHQTKTLEDKPHTNHPCYVFMPYMHILQKTIQVFPPIFCLTDPKIVSGQEYIIGDFYATNKFSKKVYKKAQTECKKVNVTSIRKMKDAQEEIPHINSFFFIFFCTKMVFIKPQNFKVAVGFFSINLLAFN